ncbi:GspH/FimT family protein [Alishewanella sp. 16-MA]|uniref:Type II secretion system protein H n=1 Tax=Alishewanella maricola TaxID=2795740 RepID=A0ABS8C4N1_9ALTE|nr:GspH/FimT family protein [Alishewanella maricola]MCB5227098.1 GspH/FimT family protein [Alishewanella maricola]
MISRGLSLIELLVALLVLVILLSIAAPAMSELMHRQHASSYMQQFSRHLHFARIQASSSQQPVKICPIQGQHCQGQWQHDPIQLLLLDPINNETVLLRELPALKNDHRLSYHRQQLQFRRDGSLDALENGTFYYCPPSRYQWHYRLVLNQAGRNRLKRYEQACPI